jgi:hypothetical protein
MIPNGQEIIKDYNGWTIYKFENRYYGKSKTGETTFTYSNVERLLSVIDLKSMRNTDYQVITTNQEISLREKGLK